MGGIIFIIMFFSMFPIGGALILIFEPGPIDSPIFYLCFIIEIPIYIIVILDFVRAKVVISDEEIATNSNTTIVNMLFNKVKTTKYKFIGLRSLSLKKGVVPFRGYTVQCILKYDKARKILDLSRFSQKQIETIQKVIMENAKKINDTEVEILEPIDKMWLFN